jgi:hypothetical protein
MNKVIHGLIAAVFGIGCWFLWAWLTMSAGFFQHVLTREHLPAFTILVLNLRPALIILPGLAVIYCLWTWFRGDTDLRTWHGFFASTMAVLVLLLLPCMFAVWLPVLSTIASLGGR